jgi:chromosome segregation ATPase
MGESMSTEKELKGGLESEIAQLRRELADLRSEVAHLIRAGARQDDAHCALRRALQETSQRLESRVNRLDVVGAVTDYRLELDGDAIERLGADIKHQHRALEDCYQWTDAHLRDLQVWVGSLAGRVWPKMSAFMDEMQRIFPKGWAFVSDHRLARKLPRNG